MRTTLRRLYPAALLCALLLTMAPLSAAEGPRPIAVAAGRFHALVLRDDGTAAATGPSAYWRGISAWTKLKAVSAGDCHSVGLRTDGTAVAVGDNYYGQCNVGRWTNLVAIAAGDEHTLGLRADGTVLAVGANYADQCEVGTWTDIIAIAAGEELSLGIKSDGTVVVAGENTGGRTEDVSSWRGVKAISGNGNHVAGLRSDGSVAECGQNYSKDIDVSGWTGVTALCSGRFHLLGLHANGTVLATGNNYKGQCDVSGWRNIVSVAAGEHFSLGVTGDGGIVFCGNESREDFRLASLLDFYEENLPARPSMAEAVRGWTDIRDVELYQYLDSEEDYGSTAAILGLKTDGSIVSFGGLGAECDVSAWSGLTRAAASGSTVLGLRADGTVLATGSNNCGQCEVSDWRGVVDLIVSDSWSIGITEDGEYLFAGYREYDPLAWLEFEGIEGCGEECKRQEKTLTKKEYKSWYKDQCKSISYKKLERSPKKYDGDMIKFTGYVFQVIYESDNSLYPNMYFIATDGKYKDLVYIKIYGELSTRILKGDKISVWGKYGGIYTYETTSGASNAIPQMTVEFYSIK